MSAEFTSPASWIAACPTLWEVGVLEGRGHPEQVEQGCHRNIVAYSQFGVTN